LFLVAALSAAPAQENRFESEIAAFEKADLTAPPAPGGIVFVGSSSIRLWKTLDKDFPQYHVINRGFGGSYVSESVHFAKRIVTPYRPKIVVFFAGTNDIADGKTPETVADDYRAFVAVVREDLPSAKFVYISISPAPSRWDKVDAIRKANQLIQEGTREDKNQRFLDTFSLMLDAKGGPRPELFVEDRLHLNPSGYALWVKALTPVLAELADKPTPRSDFSRDRRASQSAPRDSSRAGSHVRTPTSA
jgi:lysophospholipase L1-like esterase